MGFLNPALLWGAALVGVPLIIYLINRQHYQRRVWAAMEFLLRALKKNRRRLQLENLLLLLIRVAVLLLLALAMARPFLRSTSIAVVSEKEENWIFAIDTSYSMGFRDGPRSLFDRARESMAGMLQDVVKTRDRVAICTFDAEPHLIFGPERVTESNRPEILKASGDLALGTRSVDLALSFLLVKEVAARFDAGGEAGLSTPKKIIVFSDFQRRDWLSADGSPRDPAVLSLAKEVSAGGGSFHFGDLNGSDRNLSILDLTVSPEVISRDVWVQFRVTVRNWGSEDFEAVQLKLSVDGNEEMGIVFRVGAGETYTSPLIPFRFEDAGFHSVTAELRSDGLMADNRRHLALHVREGAKILLVDGEPGAGPRDRETLFLRAAFAPLARESAEAGEGRLTPYRPEVRAEDDLADTNPRDFVLVLLANVSDLPERFAGSLEAYVRDGGALIGFLGKNIDAGYYNQRLWKDGGGLLPGRLDGVRGDGRTSYHFVPADRESPLTRYFSEERREVTSLLQGVVEFTKFYALVLPDEREPPAEAAAPAPRVAPPRISFRYNDPENSPAVVDASFGRGRVLWFTSTADAEWNELPKWPDFVALLYQAVPYLVRHGETRINLQVGEVYREIFEAADYAQEVRVTSPQWNAGDSGGMGSTGGGAIGAVARLMTKIEGENRFLLTHEETLAPGIYELTFLRPGGRPPERPADPADAQPPLGALSDPHGRGSRDRQSFAVNLDPFEGDLRALAPRDLKGRFADLQDVEIFDAARQIESLGEKKAQSRGTEMWRWLIYAVLGLLLAETAVAQTFGQREKR